MSSPLPLSGRTAIVTGASRGIGRAVAVHLSSLGAAVVINYASNSTQADLLAASLPRAIAVQADVSDPSAVKSLFDAAESHFHSPPHILVHCAAITDPKLSPIASTSIEDFDGIQAVNARGTFLCCREAANRIARGGGGRIVTVSSSLVVAAMEGYGAYTASKAAGEAMTRILAKELKGTGITANCIAPGPVATDLYFEGKDEAAARAVAAMNPMGRMAVTEDVAPVVGFLCRDEAEWVNGQVIRVNGGLN